MKMEITVAETVELINQIHDIHLGIVTVGSEGLGVAKNR